MKKVIILSTVLGLGALGMAIGGSTKEKSEVNPDEKPEITPEEKERLKQEKLYSTTNIRTAKKFIGPKRRHLHSRIV